MAREDWRDDEARRWARRRDRDDMGRDDSEEDFGQADYSRDYGYDPDRRRGYRADPGRRAETYDFGQADYSDDYAYNERERRAFRRHDGGAYDDPYGGRDDRRGEPRSWMERAGDFFSGQDRRGPGRPSDRMLRSVIVERLARARGLDLRDVDVSVEDHEVTLDGYVQHRGDKRRVEDIADIEGVRHVQNNLRVHERTHWTFL